MNRPTIWIDLTDLVAWKGHYTGIPKVVANLSYAFMDFDVEPKFFIYKPSKQQFLLVTSRPVELSSDQTGGSKHVEVGKWRTQMIDMARSTYHTAPDFIRRQVTNERQEQILKLGRHLSRQIAALRNRKKVTAQTNGKANFSRGDTILVLGAGWQNPEMSASLAGLRQTIGLKVFHLVYDLSPVLMPQAFGPGMAEQYVRYLFEAAAGSDGLLAISESTARDLKYFCKELVIACPPIKVIRIGDELTNIPPVRPTTAPEPGTFVLSVGTLESRKNHRLLYNTWKLAAANGVSLPKLIIAGKVGWATRDLLYEIANDPEVSETIVIQKGLTDPEISWLYKNSLFTIYPSLYEGWGLPIAESLAHGKPCLASATSSMPEVGKDLVDYFNPYDAPGCLDAIGKYLNPATLDEKTARIKREYSMTTWKTTARQTLSSIE